MGFKELFAGKKTHVLVLLAIVLNTMNAMNDGGPEAVMSADTALNTISFALVSTFKAGVDRLLGK